MMGSKAPTPPPPMSAGRPPLPPAPPLPHEAGEAYRRRTQSYTADQWPGPPQVLPPLIPVLDRMPAYQLAAYEGADAETLRPAWADINQRYAAALRSAPPLAQDSEVAE